MKKLMAFGIIGTMFLCNASFGVDMAGKMGIGYDNGFSFKYWMEGFGIQSIVDFGYETAESGDTLNDKAEIGIGFMLKGLIPFIKTDKANLNLVLGFGIDMLMNQYHMDKTDSGMDISVLIGFSPEIFLLDNLSIETTTGLKVKMYGESTYNDVKMADDYMSIATFGQGVSIVSGAAFHFYF